jgi:hypothetical protein
VTKLTPAEYTQLNKYSNLLIQPLCFGKNKNFLTKIGIVKLTLNKNGRINFASIRTFNEQRLNQ